MIYGLVDENNAILMIPPTDFNALGAMGGMGGAGGMPSLQQMQQQMQQNPAMMRELMNSPVMQNMMNSIMQNPELVRNMIMNNPQMREVIERNPEVGHMLNDPAVSATNISERLLTLFRFYDKQCKWLPTLN